MGVVVYGGGGCVCVLLLFYVGVGGGGFFCVLFLVFVFWFVCLLFVVCFVVHSTVVSIFSMHNVLKSANEPL